jgi:hypothetical protein
MGIDVESQATLDEAIDRAKAAGADLLVDVKKIIDAAIDRIQTTLNDTGNHAAELVSATFENIDTLLDGYTATITIPPITIKLHKEQK